MNDYSPSVSHYLLSALLFVAGTAAGYWSFPLLVALYALGTASAAFITIKGAWDGRTAYWEAVAAIAKQLPGLTHEQQAALGMKIPEIRILFGGNFSQAVFVIGNTGVDFDFFCEFMENSNAYQTWAINKLEGTERESRDARRSKWHKLTAHLMEVGALAAAPAGNVTYQWYPGKWLQIRQTYILPYSKFVGRTTLPIPVERTELYQAEA